MTRKTYSLSLTAAEVTAVRMCISGELENDDGRTGHYFNPLRRVARKLAALVEEKDRG